MKETRRLYDLFSEDSDSPELYVLSFWALLQDFGERREDRRRVVLELINNQEKRKLDVTIDYSSLQADSESEIQAVRLELAKMVERSERAKKAACERHRYRRLAEAVVPADFMQEECSQKKRFLSYKMGEVPAYKPPYETGETEYQTINSKSFGQRVELFMLENWATVKDFGNAIKNAWSFLVTTVKDLNSNRKDGLWRMNWVRKFGLNP